MGEGGDEFCSEESPIFNYESNESESNHKNNTLIGKYILLCNSFVFSRIEFIFGMEVPWDNRHQPHTLLLWKLSHHGNQSETSLTPLS